MKILHVSVAGIVDKFYYPFLSMIKERGEFEQSIYIPYKKGEYTVNELKIIDKYKKQGINPIPLPIKKDWDRVFYRKKVHKYTRELIETINIKDYQIVHAHSLFSDGGVAYLLHKKYAIPYIVAVRVTDIVIFIKYFPHLRAIGRKILKNAEKIVFISPSLKKDVVRYLYKNRYVKYIEEYGEVIPNGIDNFWLNNKASFGKRIQEHSKLGIIQVSRLKKQKNIDKTIKSVYILRKKGLDITLDILGEGEERATLEELVADLKLQKFVKFYGFVSDLHCIKEYYNKNDIFVMPSTGETFGLTYIEAMSQGLPVIGVKDTGVSDFFEPNTVGCFIDRPEPEQIAEAIEKIVDNYNSMSSKCVNSVERFDWNRIINRYEKIYNESINDMEK